MKTKPFIFLIVCWMLILNGCITQPATSSIPTEYSVKTGIVTPVSTVTNTPTATSLPNGGVTQPQTNSTPSEYPTKATGSTTPVSGIAKTKMPTTALKDGCWEPDWQMIWRGSGPYLLMAMGEGPKGVFWFLTPSTLSRVSTDEENYPSFELKKMLQCDNCEDILNGTLAISARGEAWLGLSTGLLIVDKNGEWRQIPTEKVLPSADKSLGLRVLLSDDNGNVWVSNEDKLCSFDGFDWKCYRINGLQETFEVEGKQVQVRDEIVAAVSGQGNQVWFGTKHGRIILFDGKEFEIYNIRKLLNAIDLHITSLAFDKRTNSVWALDTSKSLFPNSDKPKPKRESRTRCGLPEAREMGYARGCSRRRLSLVHILAECG